MSTPPGVSAAQRFQLADLSDATRLGKIVEMMRAMSRAKRPSQVLQSFAAAYWPMRPVEHLLSVSTRDLQPPCYRLTRSIPVGQILRGEAVYNPIDTSQRRETIPVQQGGLLWELIADGQPKLIRRIDASGDPLVGELLAHCRSGLVIPLFHDGEPIYWSMQFRREPDGFDLPDFEQTMMVANFLGSQNTRLVLNEEINQLNRRLTAQFEEVARVQRALLPRQIPDIPGVEIATSYLTSDEAGGDYYDFFPLPGGRWAVLIADVAGHGAAAATVMAMLHGILHAHLGAADPAAHPDQILRYANARLVEAGVEGSFVTAFFAVYDPGTGALRFARAGHNPPVLARAGGPVRELAGDAAGPPLGLFDPYDIEPEQLDLAPGDTLVLYTDGITEAFSPGREMFGPGRLMHAVDQGRASPDAVIEAVHRDLFAHTGGARTRADDQTLVVLRRRSGRA